MSFQIDDLSGDASGRLGNFEVRIIKGRGLRLIGTSFHLDEGPDFVYVNPYRLFSRGKLLGYGRETPVTSFDVIDGDALAAWDPFEDHRLKMSVRSHIVDDTTVDTTFAVEALEDVSDYEIFVSSYFTPNHVPWYCTQQHPYLPDGGETVWFTKTTAPAEASAWPRDSRSAQIMFDGRWSVGHPPLWWNLGSFYEAPLMIQTHRYGGHSVATMAHREDCFAISGLYGYHNSQYFHLFGRSLAEGESASAVVRLVVLLGGDDIKERALEQYEGFEATQR